MFDIQDTFFDLMLKPLLKLPFWATKKVIEAAAKPVISSIDQRKESEIEEAKEQIINPTPPNQIIHYTLQGVVFGKRGYNYITKPEYTDGHILTVGGVGSGKSSCIVIPTLRVWQNSVFVIDIKGELYSKTGDFRKAIKVFNPLDETAYGYDPFHNLKHGGNLVQEARAIAQAIIPLPPDIKEPFWVESARNVLSGAVLHFYHEGLTFIDTVQTIQSTAPADLISEIMQSGTKEAQYFVSNFVGMSDKTLSGIMTELSQNIMPFVTDPHLISCLSRKKRIAPDDLERGIDVYVQLPEYLLNQWKPLLTLIVNQFLTYFEQRDESTATPILFMLDEFPRLGKIPALLDGLATLRSKKITICLIIQSLAQLDLIYGKESREVIADTCAYTAILSATDANTQDYFSRRVGTYEKPKTSDSTQYSPYIGTKQGYSKSNSTEQQRIIKPEEFATLKDIILLTPFGFFRVDKAPYYLEN